MVLPLPVGPVTTKIPSGRAIMRLSSASVDSRKPILLRGTIDFSRSNTRKTIFSPWIVGCVDTRKSIWRPHKLMLIRPSCGARVSAISMPLMTLIRTAIPAQWLLCKLRTWCNTPSIRYRIRKKACSGSK